MKILIINKFLHPNGGSETYIFRIGEELKQMGHQVEYFGMDHENRMVGNRVHSYTANMDFHTGKLAKLLYPFRILYSGEAKKKLRRVLQDMHPDVVHVNNFNFQLTPSILYEIRRQERKEGRRIRMIYTAHDSQLVCPNHLMQQYLSGKRCTKCVEGSPLHCTRNRCIHGSLVKSALGSLEALLYRILKPYTMLDQVICPSRFMKERLDYSPQLQGKTVVLGNFIDWKAQEKPEGKKFVLYFGRFSEEKGIGTLLRVIRRLPEIPFVFAGDGPLKAQVEAEINIDNRGFLKGQELKDLIGRAAFCVFPSECYENCPFTVMEALVSMTPVIGPDLGGVPELIEDRVNGELFESGNEEMLYQKVKGLWEDEDRLLGYQENCRKISFPTTREYCKELLKLYG